ncbi:hypothetical protein C8Z91_05755 [Paenibacillus elgii]|uniref:Uncharacterized protein n=1 Tax=Paenibacillus elgii TaxID=189691 RepID=A0A2T6G776_9BACL|nr:hypothetical protein C8Z91_05755 [Paenibacillus elgii]
MLVWEAAALRPFPGQAQESTGFYSVEGYEIVRTIVVSGRLNCGETDVFLRASASLFLQRMEIEHLISANGR